MNNIVKYTGITSVEDIIGDLSEPFANNQFFNMIAEQRHGSNIVTQNGLRAYMNTLQLFLTTYRMRVRSVSINAFSNDAFDKIQLFNENCYMRIFHSNVSYCESVISFANWKITNAMFPIAGRQTFQFISENDNEFWIQKSFNMALYFDLRLWNTLPQQNVPVTLQFSIDRISTYSPDSLFETECDKIAFDNI